MLNVFAALPLPPWAAAQPIVMRAALALIVVVVVRAVSGCARDVIRRCLARARVDAHVWLLCDRLIYVGSLAISAVWVLAIFGVQLTVLATVLGIAGLAAGLALQDLLRNLVAGFYILIERPFTVGDKVQFKTYDGIVEAVRLRTTSLRTVKGERVVIPNAMLFADAVVNRSVLGSGLVQLRVVVPASPTSSLTFPASSPAAAAPKLLPGATVATRLPGTDLTASAAAGPASAGPSPSGAEQRYAAELLRVLNNIDQAAGQPKPRVQLEALTTKKVALRAELWANDARATAARVAWAVRRCLPQAKILVLSP